MRRELPRTAPWAREVAGLPDPVLSARRLPVTVPVTRDVGVVHVSAAAGSQMRCSKSDTGEGGIYSVVVSHGTATCHESLSGTRNYIAGGANTTFQQSPFAKIIGTLIVTIGPCMQEFLHF